MTPPAVRHDTASGGIGPSTRRGVHRKLGRAVRHRRSSREVPALTLRLGAGLLVAAGALLPGGPAFAAIDVATVSVIAGVDRFAGTLGADPYSLRLELEGTGITSVSVQTPKGSSFALTQSDDGWGYTAGGYPDLCSIQSDPGIGFGTFVFTATDGVDTETATVDWSHTCPGPDPHSGWGDLSTPTHGQTSVVRDTPIEWSCADGPCGNVGWYSELYPVSVPGPDCGKDVLDPSATSYQPICHLRPDALYELWLWSGTLLTGGLQHLATSPSADPFDYEAGFESLNRIQFTTEPATVPTLPTPGIAVLLLGILALTGRSALKTRGSAA